MKKKLRERRVPSSAFGRAAGFAGMGASLVFGSMRDSVSKMQWNKAWHSMKSPLVSMTQYNTT